MIIRNKALGSGHKLYYYFWMIQTQFYCAMLKWRISHYYPPHNVLAHTFIFRTNATLTSQLA